MKNLSHFLNSSICTSYMYDKQLDNARANLSMTNISKFIIPFPSFSEQKRIVEKVGSLMAFYDRLEDNLTQGIYKSEKLVNALVNGI